MLTAVLVTAALVAGATGSWSPCGLSMMGTLGAPGGRRTINATAAFTAGALAGGVVTFGGLAFAGSVLGAGSAVTLAAAASLLAAAAALDARGARIVPQIRRQVPETWRRAAPLPVAALGYGLLLGMGFTTFVLSYALPAVAAACLASGDPVAGIAAGLAFGIGRALPIAVLAPLEGSAPGRRAADAMMERPAALRGFRAAGAAPVLLTAIAFGTGAA